MTTRATSTLLAMYAAWFEPAEWPAATIQGSGGERAGSSEPAWIVRISRG
jgi:hypothetical protein